MEEQRERTKSMKGESFQERWREGERETSEKKTALFPAESAAGI